MRIGTDEKLFVVVDPPSLTCELGDLLFEASLRDLERQFRGGLTCDANPALFTDRKEAEIEAFGRQAAARAANAIASYEAAGLDAAERLEIYDGDGKLLFETELRVPRGG